jgi:hypothetical protein
MTPDPNRPEPLLSVCSDVEAAAIVTALAEHGIEAFAVGGYTSGFRAEAPGEVRVLVKHVDADRARQTLAEIGQEPGEVDWSKVDVMETAEAPTTTDEGSDDEADWSPVTGRLWVTVVLAGAALCFMMWLFARLR